MGDLQPLALERRCLRRDQRVLERTEHQRQRGAELVADVGEERRLGPVEFSQGLGAPTLLLIGLGVGDGSCESGGNQVVKAAYVVERQTGLALAIMIATGMVGPRQVVDRRRDGQVRRLLVRAALRGSRAGAPGL